MIRLRGDGYLEIGVEPRDGSDSIVASCFLGRDDYATYSIYAVGDFGWIEGEMYTERNYPILISAKTVAERFNGRRVAGSDRQIWYMIEAILTADGRYVHLDPWLAIHAGEGEGDESWITS